MRIKKILTTGIIAGLAMGFVLFIAGAIFSRIIYGPQFAPPGKFEPEQLNPFYFIWTKLLIGVFLGILFTFIYEALPLAKRLKSGLNGLKYGFVFWFIISLWDISHPLVYSSGITKDRLFWLVYSLFGFLALGYVLGLIYKKYNKKKEC
jgi:hypothetical protein